MVVLIVILSLIVISGRLISDWQYKSATYNEAKDSLERDEKIEALIQFKGIKGYKDLDERINDIYEELYM